MLISPIIGIEQTAQEHYTQTCWEHLINVLQRARLVHCCRQPQAHADPFLSPDKSWTNKNVLSAEKWCHRASPCIQLARHRSRIKRESEIQASSLSRNGIAATQIVAQSTNSAIILVQGVTPIKRNLPGCCIRGYSRRLRERFEDRGISPISRAFAGNKRPPRVQRAKITGESPTDQNSVETREAEKQGSYLDPCFHWKRKFILIFKISQ